VFPAGLPVSMFGLTVACSFAISIGLLAGGWSRSKRCGRKRLGLRRLAAAFRGR